MNQNIPKEKFRIIGVEEGAEVIARPHVSYMSDVWRRFRKNKLALFALVMLIILSFFVIFGPAMSGYAFEETDPTARNTSPSAEHWFGTDSLGRDLFARVWQGGRVSLLIGFLGAAVSAILGCLYGGVSAYFGGKVDTVMMRFLEIVNSIPYLIIVILFSLIFNDGGILSLILAMTITGWCGTARLVRGQMLQLKSQEYVLAAQALGVSPMRIILRHMIPNTLSVIIVSVTFAIPNYIFSEAFLSYMGLGIKSPNTSWGALASNAQAQFMFYPFQLFFPAVMIAVTMLAFTMMGDGLRDALDPRLRK